MMEGRQTGINILANIVNFAVGLLVSFFFTPFLIRMLGQESYGFVGLADSFTSYLAVLTAAFNAMAGRFIALSFHRGDREGVQTYFSTVFFTNLALSACCAAVFALITARLSSLTTLPAGREEDIHILFGCVFAAFCLGLCGSVFSAATFCKNRLDLRAAWSVAQSVLRVAILGACFLLGPPHLLYMGLCTLLLTAMELGVNLLLTRRLLPGLRPQWRCFDRKAVRTLVSSGIWNAAVQLGNLLMTGLDLLLAGMFLGPASMTLIAVSKSIPNNLANFANMLSNMFAPGFTRLYAQGDRTRLLGQLRGSFRLTGWIISVPIAGVMAFGDLFYRLWLPGQDAGVLQILTLLGMATILVDGSVLPLYSVFTAANRLKLPSLTLLAGGLVSTGLVLLLLQTTDLGIYAIAGVSTVAGLLRELLFLPAYAAKCLGAPLYAFYRDILRSLLLTGLSLAVCLGFRLLIRPASWMELLVTGSLCAVVCWVGGLFVGFTASQRRLVMNRLRQKIPSRPSRRP